MREGYIAVQYLVRRHDGKIEIENIDRDYIVNFSCMHVEKKLGKEAKLEYQLQDFLSDEFDYHLENELMQFIFDDMNEGTVCEAIYYSFFMFTVRWEKSSNIQEGDGEVDSHLTLENLTHEKITDDPKLIEDFFINWNNRWDK